MKAFSNEAVRLFTAHFHQPPSWVKKHYVQLAELLKVRPDLRLEEFSLRYSNFLSSRDSFYQKHRGSLCYFCPNFDQFIASNGNGEGTSEPARSNPAALSSRGEDILQNAVKGAESLSSMRIE